MHDNHIIQMVRKLAPVLKDPPKAKKILDHFWETRMALVWTIEQVHRAANERERVLTNPEASKVLQTLHQEHNPQTGLKWVDLWDHLDLYRPGRKMTRAELNRFVAKDIITVQK
jgi:hypothetical protein